MRRGEQYCCRGISVLRGLHRTDRVGIWQVRQLVFPLKDRVGWTLQYVRRVKSGTGELGVLGTSCTAEAPGGDIGAGGKRGLQAREG